jgi:hypothetical protein
LTSWPTLGRSPGQRQKHLRIGRRQVLRRPRLGHSPNPSAGPDGWSRDVSWKPCPGSSHAMPPSTGRRPCAAVITVPASPFRSPPLPGDPECGLVGWNLPSAQEAERSGRGAARFRSSRRGSEVDDDFALGVAVPHILHGRGGLAQRVGPVDNVPTPPDAPMTSTFCRDQRHITTHPGHGRQPGRWTAIPRGSMCGPLARVATLRDR